MGYKKDDGQKVLLNIRGNYEGTSTFEVPKEITSLTFMVYDNDEAML